MTLTNQYIVAIFFVVPYYEFYVIFVEVTIYVKLLRDLNTKILINSISCNSPEKRKIGGQLKLAMSVLPVGENFYFE